MTPHNTPRHQTVNILAFDQATFLYSQGIIPEIIPSGRRFVFQFVVDDEFIRVSNLYNNNSMIGCLDYAEAMKNLKNKMYELDNGGQR